MALAVTLPTLAATEALARVCADQARIGDVIALGGDLGAGKTAFARAFIKARAARASASDLAVDVPSPTFTLVQAYEIPDGTVYHFDLYRIETPQDALELGIEEAMADGVCLIEWADRLGPLLPADHLAVTLSLMADSAGQTDRRHVVVEGGPAWNERLRVIGDRVKGSLE